MARGGTFSIVVRFVEKCDIEEFLKSGALDLAYAKSSVSLPANSYRMRPYHR